MKILVTGGTGLIGKGIEESKVKDHTLLIIHRRNYEYSSLLSDHRICNIENKRKLELLFAENLFDVVVHLAGISNVDYVEQHYEESYSNNINGTSNIVELSNKYGAYLIHVSTNAVFNGESAPYSENDAVDPINKYGKIKVECETIVCKKSSNYVIVRPILMFGWNHSFSRSNPVTWAIQKLENNETIQIVDDVFENPIYNIACGKALWNIIENKPSGIVHLGGAERISRFHFIQKVAEVFNLNKQLIQPVPSSFFKNIAKRPADTTFKTERMRKELKIEPLEIKSALLDMKNNRISK